MRGSHPLISPRDVGLCTHRIVGGCVSWPRSPPDVRSIDRRGASNTVSK